VLRAGVARGVRTGRETVLEQVDREERGEQVAVAEHEAILRAVEARDLIGAQTAMRHHLLCSEARWLEGFASSEE